MAYDGNSKNTRKEEYKQLVKNVNSKQDIIHNDRDYSEYMENGNIDNRNSSEDQFNIHQINVKTKGKFKQKAPLKIGKLKQQFQINNSNRNQKLRVKNSNSQVNNYKNKMNSIEISDYSEENNDSNDLINDLEPACEQTDKRRVHTDFDRHHSNDKYVPMGNMIKQNMFKNPKEDKIKNKIKSRRRSNFDFEMDNSSNNGDDLIMNAEDLITYEHEQMLYNNPSYPDIIEGKYILTNCVDEDSKEFDDPYQEPINGLYDNSPNNQNPDLQNEFTYSDYTSSNNQDIEDEDEIQIDYAYRCIQKIDEDMRAFHNKNIAIRKAMQEIYEEKCENEIITLTDWKKNALVKLKNYKVVIKELMSQISLLQEEIDKLKSEQEKFLNEYDTEQQQWIEDKSLWDGERKQMSKQIAALEKQKQDDVISYNRSS